MTNPIHIDPHLAARKCSKLECDVVLLRNATPPMRWSDVAAILECSQGEARRLWSSANRKVNGGYVPPVVSRPAVEDKLAPGYVKPPTKAEMDRAMRATDPDVVATWRGIPMVGGGNRKKTRAFRRPSLPPR